MELANYLSDQSNGEAKTERFGNTGIVIVSSVVVLEQPLSSEILHNLYVIIIDIRITNRIIQAIVTKIVYHLL